MDDIDKLVNLYAAKAIMQQAVAIAQDATLRLLSGDQEGCDNGIVIAMRLQDLANQYRVIAGDETFKLE